MMDLKSGYPFWAIRNGLLQAFPRLQQDLHIDVAIIGGGISAALIANELAAQGHEVALFEQRDIAWGSTAASTALLQYEIDTHMTELARRFGEAEASLAYTACAQALEFLRELAREIGRVDFAWNQSLYYASRQRDGASLAKEFALRRRHGLQVEWFGREDIQARYGIDAAAAILSHQAARMDPYRMTYRLLARLRARGVQVYDRTSVKELVPGPRGVRLRSEEGFGIRARHVVLAGGYANEQWLSMKVARNRSSYAFITDPIDTGALGFLRNTLLWETARPYLYLRTTHDGRLLVGGADDNIDLPDRRDARVLKKARTLQKQVHKLFPHIPLRPAFAWAGTFAETPDGLPFFGPHAQYGPHVHFAMAYGGNGIVFSMIGAGLIRAWIERRSHPLAKLFSFQRLER